MFKRQQEAFALAQRRAGVVSDDPTQLRQELGAGFERGWMERVCQPSDVRHIAVPFVEGSNIWLMEIISVNAPHGNKHKRQVESEHLGAGPGADWN